MNNQYDAILYYDNLINEEYGDDRLHGKKGGVDLTPKYVKTHADWMDPKFISKHSFANSLRGMLNNGDGWSNKITEFSKYIVVEVSYYNTLTGRSASKTFLIVFKEKGDGWVYSTHNRYRTISGISQASSYIRSSSSSLINATQSILG